MSTLLERWETTRVCIVAALSQSSKPLTASEISALIGASSQLTTRACKSLEADGLITVAGEIPRTRSKPATLWKLTEEEHERRASAGAD